MRTKVEQPQSDPASIEQLLSDVESLQTTNQQLAAHHFALKAINHELVSRQLTSEARIHHLQFAS